MLLLKSKTNAQRSDSTAQTAGQPAPCAGKHEIRLLPPAAVCGAAGNGPLAPLPLARNGPAAVEARLLLLRLLPGERSILQAGKPEAGEWRQSAGEAGCRFQAHTERSHSLYTACSTQLQRRWRRQSPAGPGGLPCRSRLLRCARQSPAGRHTWARTQQRHSARVVQMRSASQART